MKHGEELIGVHVISEFIFCRRAMLVTHSSRCEDEGREPSILRLDYSPNYTLLEIERDLRAMRRTLLQLALVGAVTSTVGFLLGLFIHRAFFWGGLLAAGVAAYHVLYEIPDLFRLLRDHRRASFAIAAEPNLAIFDDQPVDWWGLKAAGFVAHTVSKTLVDPVLGIRGRPWRILRRGELAIPVFVRTPRDEILPQQRVRIDAYCELIRVNEGSRSPYGIVLDRGAFAGTAVTPTAGDRQQLMRAIYQIPRVVWAWRNEQVEPSAPSDSDFARCRKCPHGRPVRYRPLETDTYRYGERLRVYAISPPSDSVIETFHSPCGDLFHWIPKHERALELAVTPVRVD